MLWPSVDASAINLSIRADEKELADDYDDANHKIWGRTSKQESVA